MEEVCIIQLNSFPVQTVLKTLLKDRTTQKNIIWATNSYAELGQRYKSNKQITIDSLSKLDSTIIQPRITKKSSEKQKRTRKYAEVFTPSWICNEMINLIKEHLILRLIKVGKHQIKRLNSKYIIKLGKIILS